MMKPNPGRRRYFARLRALRRRGKGEFVWRVGVVRWGLPFGLAMGAIYAFVLPLVEAEPIGGPARILYELVSWMVSGLLVGPLFGLWMWHFPPKPPR